MNQAKLEGIIRNVQFGMIAVGLFLIGIFLVISLIKTPKEQTVTFNVTGIVNGTDATTLTQLHYECIKYCTSQKQYPEECWKQCATLGKELLASCPVCG